MKIETITHIERLNGQDSRLEVYVVVDEVKLATPNIVCSGPTQDVQDFADGSISWDQLSYRWSKRFTQFAETQDTEKKTQDIGRYLVRHREPCAVLVREHNGDVHYMWLPVYNANEQALHGKQHDKGYEASFTLSFDLIASIRKIPTEKYRHLSGWKGAL